MKDLPCQAFLLFVTKSYRIGAPQCHTHLNNDVEEPEVTRFAGTRDKCSDRAAMVHVAFQSLMKDNEAVPNPPGSLLLQPAY